ncbi:MAG: LytR/AlgR family response regulator transcription factor [Thermoanaerobaculia bacterium]
MSAERLRIAVVDDEPPARQRIEDLLARREDVEVVASVGSGREAVRALRRDEPDLVFLDVQMPEVSGLEVVERVGPAAMPAVVFVTAYDRYAVRAFELCAVDYLLKPYEDERFFAAFERALDRIRLERVERVSDELLRLLGGGAGDRRGEAALPEPPLERLAVRKHDRIVLLPVEQVDFIEADGSYERVHAGGEVHLVREGMTRLEERLDPRRFARIHRSTIVNLDRVDVVEAGAAGDGAVRLRDGTALRVSRTRAGELRRRLGIS